MQQLTPRWFELDNGHAGYRCTSFPAQPDFIADALADLTALGMSIMDCSEGADRAQISFISEQQQFMLCYDATCEAIWLESLGVTQQDAVKILINKLNSR